MADGGWRISDGRRNLTGAHAGRIRSAERDSVPLSSSAAQGSAFFQPDHADDGHSTKGGSMPSRELPPRPDLDHLKREARSLQQAARRGDPDALQRLRSALGTDAAPKLTDAQRAI